MPARSRSRSALSFHVHLYDLAVARAAATIHRPA
jgi:hypothetical protein